ncbi:HAchain-likeQ2 phosphatase non-receptor type substrate 1-like isoform X2 [Podarcis lilfordi]|uniref:HAchain-likeQ2 phosphatase non-receptor type substrate 1-like isoform X2 n=1 Tax=Podarcis lilfordi TaxID=74358 RepID=A0AA35L6D6_9SAUR|nr:HAchain-likeQ2 phosphatase non-receptor type substrate 1-like isoform X2 [Podarcis lilfordi]
MPSFSCLLLFLQGAWAAVIIQVPSSPVQAGPHSNVFLPCHFSLDPPRPINVSALIVKWSLRGRTIIMWHGSISIFRPRGAVLNSQSLQEGNASLCLTDVRGEDAGEYTCSVSHTPDVAEGKVALKIEAPPRLTLGPTEVPLGKPINLTCAASDFYPGRVSVKWLRGSETLKVDSPPAKLEANYHFYAESVLNFIPQISDDGVTFSCHIQHQAAKDPIRKDIELKVQALPRLTLGLTDVELGEPSNFLCVASDFYPGNVSVKWLRGSETLKVDSPPVQEGPDGLFYAESVLEFTPQISDAGVTFSCHIHHQARKDPVSQDFELKVVARPELHMLTRPPGKTFLVAECLVCGFYPQNVTVQWLQNGEPIQGKIYESELVQNPNGTFSTGSVFFPKQGHFAASYTCQVQHEALEAPLEETIPWEPEALGYFGSPMTWLLGSLGHVVGLGMGIGATLMYRRRRAP